MHEAVKAFYKETGTLIELRGGGAAAGISTSASCAADLGGTCRHTSKKLNEDSLGVDLTIVGWDALAIVAHSDLKVDNLSKESLRNILNGKVKNWQELGGENLNITVAGRLGMASGVGMMFREIILENANFTFNKDAELFKSSGPVELFVERTPGAIAITGISSAHKRNLKILSIDGNSPTTESIASGDYPYYRPLYISHNSQCDKGGGEFVKWLISEKGQAVVESQGTVSLKQGRKLASLFQYFPPDTSRITNLKELRNAVD